MTTEILYTYLGTNGTVTTPVHLEGVPAMQKIRIKPDIGKKLTDGKTVVTEKEKEKEREVTKRKEI